jgi:nitroreductase
VNETLKTIHGLTTTRTGNFSDRAVTDEDVQTVVRAAVRAANASARQDYSIIIMGDAGYLMQFLTGAIDASLAVQTAVIAARLLGIGSLVTNRVVHHDLEIACRLLELPATGCFPLLALCLGYPKQEPAGKRPGNSTRH